MSCRYVSGYQGCRAFFDDSFGPEAVVIECRGGACVGVGKRDEVVGAGDVGGEDRGNVGGVGVCAGGGGV